MQVHAARLMVRYAARQVDAGIRGNTYEASMAKCWAGDAAMKVATDAVQIFGGRSEEHTSELQSQSNLVCRLLLEKKKKIHEYITVMNANHSQISYAVFFTKKLSPTITVRPCHLTLICKVLILIEVRQRKRSTHSCIRD